MLISDFRILKSTAQGKGPTPDRFATGRHGTGKAD
jgi:hypothetical protein